MSQQQADDLIIQQVLHGDTSAYTKLVDRYQGYVFTLVLRYVSNNHLAEELAQDVFIKAYRMLPGFKGESKFSTWLYTIVNTTCLSHLRNKTSHITFVEQEQLTALIEQTSIVKPVSTQEQKEQKQLLQEAIDQLSPADAQIVTLYYLAEQSIDEIAKILSLSSNNIKVRLFRSRQKLKEILTTQHTNSI